MSLRVCFDYVFVATFAVNIHFGTDPSCSAEFLVPLVTLADFYNVKPLIEKYVKMLKVAPNVSNVDKLRVAIKVNSTSLEVGISKLSGMATTCLPIPEPGLRW